MICDILIVLDQITWLMSWNRVVAVSVQNLNLSLHKLISFDEYPPLQMQSLFSSNSESHILGELGVNSSLHFLGPTRGVLPIGPNGIHGLTTTLQPSPLSDAETNAAILSYNYTFDHQGLTSNISCIYDTQSPIRVSAVHDNNFSVAVNGSCNEIGLAEVTHLQDYLMPNTNRTLTFWACQSAPTGKEDPAYYIYLRGCGFYETEIGNISCTVSPIQPAIFPVTYQSNTHAFSAQKPITVSAPSNIFSYHIEYAISKLGGFLLQAQSVVNNLVAASMHDLAIQGFGFSPLIFGQNGQYLPLYEAMIRGMLVDEVCTASNSLEIPLLMGCSLGNIHAVLTFNDDRPTTAFILYSYSKRNDDCRGNWLGREASAYCIFDANDDPQPCFLGCCVDIYSKGEEESLHI